MRGIVVLGACALAAACTTGASTDALGGFPGPGPGGDGTGSTDASSDTGSTAAETATTTSASDGGGNTGSTTSAGSATEATSTPGSTSSADTTTSTSDTTTSTSDTTTSTSDTTTSTSDTTTSTSDTTTSTTTSSSTSDTTTSTTSTTTTDGCASFDYSDDFEGGQGLWTHAPTSGIAGDDPWQIGTANKGGVTCHSGSSCWATYLTGLYTGCETGELVSPIIDLSACAASGLTVQVSFWQWYEYEGTPTRWWDGGMVQLSANGGTTWSDVTPSPGYQGTIDGGDTCNPPGSGEIEGHQGWSGLIYGNFWHPVTVNVGPAFRTSNFRVRFVHGTDPGTQEYGWIIDDFAVTTF